MKKYLFAACLLLAAIAAGAVYFASPTPQDLSAPEYCEDVVLQTAESLPPEQSAEELLDLGRSFYLYDFSDRPTAIFYQLRPRGYAIYDYRKAAVLEYSLENDHAYYTDPAERWYYDGVLQYYGAVEGGFQNLATGRLKKG
ncbi:MAG: hypothetical protein IJX52_01115 [Oscillibacter sp.]|nr:hypothetical protein [Oscillibacter sp.]